MAILSCGHIFDVKNLNTDDTGLTDEYGFFFCFAEKFGSFR